MRKTVDLTPYRGERLFLSAAARFAAHGSAMILVLDDLQIQ